MSNTDKEVIGIIEGDPVPTDYDWVVKIAKEIQKHGYDEKTSIHFALLIQSNQSLDSEGNVIVVENGEEVTRLKIKLPQRDMTIK